MGFASGYTRQDLLKKVALMFCGQDFDFYDNTPDFDEDTPDSAYCTACGEECIPITIDEGIGSYEYWGSKAVHHDLQRVSPCCHAPTVDAPLADRCRGCGVQLDDPCEEEDRYCSACRPVS